MLKQKAIYVERIQNLFQDLGTGQHDTLTIDDFERKMDDARVKAWFKMLDMEVGDVSTLVPGKLGV